jgi:hypothetical protein
MAKTYWLRFGSGDPRVYGGLSPTFLIFKDSSGTNVTPPAISEVSGTSTGLYAFTWGTTTSIGFLADAATTSPGTTGRYVSGSLDPVDRMDEVGTTLVAIGTTLNAIGTTGIAIGTTGIAIGTTAVSYGLLNFGLGTTNVALGTTNSALGTTNVALGTTSVALGITAIGYGVTNLAVGTTIQSYLSGASSPWLLSLGTTASSFGSTSADPVDIYGYLKRIQENLEGNEVYIKSSGVLSISTRGSSTLLATKTLTNSVSLVTKS